MPARMRQSARPRQKGNDRAAPKQASEGPGESEARFRAIAELSGDWYWEQDASHRFTWAFVRGGSAGAVSSIIGKTRWELGEQPLNGTWEEHRRLLDARQPFSDFHVRLVDENGAEHFFSTTGVPTFDSAGIFTGYRGLARRITQRKRAEQLLRLEHTVARSVTEADSVAAALKAVIRTVCEAQDWECGRFFRVDDEAGALRFAEAWSKPGPQFDRYIEHSRKVAYIPGVGLAGKVWQSGEPMWVADITRDARVWQQAIAVEAGMHGAFVFPVNSGGKTIGVLAFNSTEIREPDEHLMQAIHVIGAQIGQFVQRKHKRRTALSLRGALLRLPRDRPGHHREQAKRGGVAALSRFDRHVGRHDPARRSQDDALRRRERNRLPESRVLARGVPRDDAGRHPACHPERAGSRIRRDDRHRLDAWHEYRIPAQE